MGERADNTAHWYAIYTQPGQENRAESNLNAWRVETFFPRLKERRQNRYTRAVSYQVKPLFPRYLFARFEASSRLHDISLTRGVRRVVTFGQRPAEVNEEIIRTLRLHVGEDGYVRLDDELRDGDEVVIIDGPLAGISAIFKERMKCSERVMLLLASVNYQGRIVIDRASVEKGKAGICGAEGPSAGRLAGLYEQ